ncbi:hypothetical protein ABAC460_21370 [Asticcacaulis sp. AC460]|uniref:hypothetical protein n=1 Tax=Asticcacaulis sp. AC460 TaxID=1282360 RepID=UPI0003C3BD3E|nr:hypothetical protein [Asticcacaulis sp. AC460]ESQ87123.1 hypothetical protein ABAC460_21370 [Asticcacaulis sp. AC460]
MQRHLPSWLVSILLHAGLLALAYIGWATAPKPVKVTSIAVEIISETQSQEMAPAPVDELAVNDPQPIPAVEDVQPTPPEPEPQPVPTPQKATAPAKPEKKPEPAKKDKAPKPDPKGNQKPKPDKQASAADDLLNRSSTSPAQSKSRIPPRASTKPTDGRSDRGAAAEDAGAKADLDALTDRLGQAWTLNCDVPGVRSMVIQLTFKLSPNGRVIEGPTWANPRSDQVWRANSELAIQAVKKTAPFPGLNPGVYNKKLKINFDAAEVCRGR